MKSQANIYLKHIKCPNPQCAMVIMVILKKKEQINVQHHDIFIIQLIFPG